MFRSSPQGCIYSSNIQGGFRGAGLVPFDLEQTIMGLDVKLRTPSPPPPPMTRPGSRKLQATPWSLGRSRRS
jgi:hypothetical protein